MGDHCEYETYTHKTEIVDALAIYLGSPQKILSKNTVSRILRIADVDPCSLIKYTLHKMK